MFSLPCCCCFCWLPPTKVNTYIFPHLLPTVFFFAETSCVTWCCQVSFGKIRFPLFPSSTCLSFYFIGSNFKKSKFMEETLTLTEMKHYVIDVDHRVLTCAILFFLCGCVCFPHTCWQVYSVLLGPDPFNPEELVKGGKTPAACCCPVAIVTGHTTPTTLLPRSVTVWGKVCVNQCFSVCVQSVQSFLWWSRLLLTGSCERGDTQGSVQDRWTLFWNVFGQDFLT